MTSLNYRNETLNEMNKYFEMKLATVFRDKEENLLPSKTTLNKKTSNIFGSLSSNFIENLNLKYDFAVNNNLDEIEYNDLEASISYNNFSSTFNFVKEMNEMGDESFLKNTTTINLMIRISQVLILEEIEKLISLSFIIYYNTRLSYSRSKIQ